MNDTHSMQQRDATSARPFYSVTYRYVNGSTAYTCNRFDDTPLAIGNSHRTQRGTADLELAKRVADACVRSNGIAEAWVHVTHDGYNHREIHHSVA